MHSSNNFQTQTEVLAYIPILKLAFEKSIDSYSLELHCMCTLEMVINKKDFISERLHTLMKTQHSTRLFLKSL